jgi:hypothetical protein
MFMVTSLLLDTGFQKSQKFFRAVQVYYNFVQLSAIMSLNLNNRAGIGTCANDIPRVFLALDVLKYEVCLCIVNEAAWYRRLSANACMLSRLSSNVVFCIENAFKFTTVVDVVTSCEALKIERRER